MHPAESYDCAHFIRYLAILLPARSRSRLTLSMFFYYIDSDETKIGYSVLSIDSKDSYLTKKTVR